jgi:hypothetical protein
MNGFRVVLDLEVPAPQPRSMQSVAQQPVPEENTKK